MFFFDDSELGVLGFLCPSIFPLDKPSLMTTFGDSGGSLCIVGWVWYNINVLLITSHLTHKVSDRRTPCEHKDSLCLSVM